MSDNQEGWVKDENTGAWYYYTDGEVTTGWKDINGYTYYFNYPGGSMGWSKEVDGKYLGPDGKMVTSEGWVNTDPDNYGTWYYVGAHEKVVTGWNKVGNDFHYFNYPGGSMTYENTIDGFHIDNDGNIDSGTGWLKDEYSGNWYYLTDGKMTTGWEQDGDNWYYLNDDGSMATDWKYINGDWYYFHSDGSMATGWVQDKGIWYFLYNNGSMAHDDTFDGYRVDKSGKMITGRGWVPSDGSRYFLKDDGSVATDWLYDKGNWYYLYPKGSMAHNTMVDGWYVDDSGKWITDEDSSNSQWVSDTNSSDDILSLIKRLDSSAKDYGSFLDLSTPNRRVLNLFRFFKYGNSGRFFTDLSWAGTLGDDDGDFVSHVCVNDTDDYNKLGSYIGENGTEAIIHGKQVDLPHLAATTLGYTSSPLIPDFWTGWGGDVATAMNDVIKLQSKGSKKTAYELATEVIGSDLYSCSKIDIDADIDAIKISSMLKSDTIGNILDSYYKTVNGDTRREILLNDLGFSGKPTVDELNDKIYGLMTGHSGFGSTLEGWSLKHLATYNGTKPTDEVINAVTRAFSEYILNKM